MKRLGRRIKKKKQLFFYPKFSEKCKGPIPIKFKSRWEQKFGIYLDLNTNVKEWSFERRRIWYFDPTQNRRRMYIPDFWVEWKDGSNYIIEIKPSNETRPPVKRGRMKQRTFLIKEATWKRNQAKWNEARKYCEKVGSEFIILTEKELFDGVKA